MDKKTLARQANVLITVYINEYKSKYKVEPKINRYREKWAFQDVIESVGLDRAKELIIYYFGIDSRTPHPIQWFLYNFDNLDEAMSDLAEDEKKRAAIREKTKQRVKEWDEQRSRSN